MRAEEHFPVRVTLGKKTDLLKLKSDVVDNLKDRQEAFRKSRTALYSSHEMEDVDECMVCSAPSRLSTPRLNVYGAAYCQCNTCGHVYVVRRPSEKAIAAFYQSDQEYAATYTDHAAAEARLETIGVPWAKWMIETYRSRYGREPRRVVDVGAGGGHFVEACRRLGLDACGIEISEASCSFANMTWGITHDSRDFLDVASEYEGSDVVTFWGLLEHTVDPSRFLHAARQAIAGSLGGMVIAKLPRWESLSTAAQSVSSETVLRHLDPRGHIMCFTDGSAAELYYRNQLKPIAAWYYGMDVYELIMQMCNHVGSHEVLTGTGFQQVEIQQWIDEARLADGIILAGAPT